MSYISNTSYLVYGLMVIVFILLAIAIRGREREEERSFWGKIVFVFISYLLSLNLGTVKLPLGIFIAYIILNKKPRPNKNLKQIALVFSLVLFVAVHYLIPFVPISNVQGTREMFKQIDSFEEVKSFQKFSKEAPIQDEIRQHGDDYTVYMFRVFVLKQKGIPIKDEEWFAFKSYEDLDFYWLSQTTKSHTRQISQNHYEGVADEITEYIRFNQTGEEYIGVFKNDGSGKFYLDYVIEGRFKQNQAPKSFFEF